MQLDPITRAVLDAMQEGVLIIDAQERIVYGNRAYVAFLEKEAGGPIGPIEGYPLRLLRPCRCSACSIRPASRRWPRSSGSWAASGRLSWWQISAS